MTKTINKKIIDQNSSEYYTKENNGTNSEFVKQFDDLKYDHNGNPYVAYLPSDLFRNYDEVHFRVI